MATTSGKRKRADGATQLLPAKQQATAAAAAQHKSSTKQSSNKPTSKADISARTNGSHAHDQNNFHVQIVTGSYERVLHGISATIPPKQLQRQTETSNAAGTETPSTTEGITFSDTFLFAAHESAIRCLAISPPTDESDKRYLATGDSGHRINVYTLSTAPPTLSSNPKLPSLSGTTITENRRNRNLGSLNIHERAITRLQYPTKTKLFSAAEDATIQITRTKDWTTLESIKAPIPKPIGRPSGDTAAPGEVPAGVNDFAIHPSQKVMLSVGKGEKCLRLWNLMTGKKAGVLNFDRELLSQANEGRFASGDGRRVLWEEPADPEAEADLNFVVGLERAAALYGVDSKPKAVIKATPSTKFHEMRFLTLPSSAGSILAVSTEDGRILFFDVGAIGNGEDGKLPLVPCVAQLGGTAAGIVGRIKDFDIVPLPKTEAGEHRWLFVTGSSDGSIRLWNVFEDEVSNSTGKADSAPRQAGTAIAAQKTDARITCLGAFMLDGKVSDATSDATEALAGADLEDGPEEEDSDDSDSE
ncbi:hypothetical protein CLAFUW4_09993 [Fulvia fulva]|uniref:WD40 repeat-like protein n=1 Tax=Passalora fulva TaxID=5499 RepID=A0A9Q8UUH0_PASFU|nr:uncharacterized protein CLAFUR5_12252 [Fulvia fulva]KAK4615615.1 hypothetical protein CLAFUR4_09997 [Fulvia fulva]KAK4616590.1 hypothetical protein CLAFUR0_09994 [Fulvia fulva]UJO22931.1 hypothetical protein CLAFUR5_12252 [Fulvia fulva]WPV19657.1 hypothetical protein CLAFUW4_09993 [Fulvia fulva]WPV33831.1 hypothetical protein CLAFUW7_09994 [Fulvia fulva]